MSEPSSMTDPGVVLTDAVVISSAGDLDQLRVHAGPLVGLHDLDQWRSGLTIPLKELKIADRQTLVLLRTLQALLARSPSIDREAAAVHLAVGPARTDLDSLLKWARRIEPGEALPLVHPAAAVGLLPNMPLAWVSIQQRWHGEGAAWAGFEEAGFQAVAGAVEALQGGLREAVVAAVSSPESFFVRPVLTDHGLPADGPFPEIGVALRFRQATPGTAGLQVADLRETGPDGEGETPSPGHGQPGCTNVASAPGRPSSRKHLPLRPDWGQPLVAAFPLALALAWAGLGAQSSAPDPMTGKMGEAQPGQKPGDPEGRVAVRGSGDSSGREWSARLEVADA